MIIKIKEEGYIKYQMTTWQGEVNIDGEDIIYRWSEDDNGDEFFVLIEDNWVSVDLADERYLAIYTAIMEYGTPEFDLVKEIEISTNDMDMNR